MSPRFLRACQTFQPAEKACWEILLREEAEGREIPPAVLDEAMDRTLTQLWSLLRTSSVATWLKEAQSLAPLLPHHEKCGLPTLLTYFNAGQRALELIAKELDGPRALVDPVQQEKECSDLQFAFTVLVQCHLQNLCGDCKQGAQCSFSDSRGSWRRAAESTRGKTTAAGRTRRPWAVKPQQAPHEAIVPKRRVGESKAGH